MLSYNRLLGTNIHLGFTKKLRSTHAETALIGTRIKTDIFDITNIVIALRRILPIISRCTKNYGNVFLVAESNKVHSSLKKTTNKLQQSAAIKKWIPGTISNFSWIHNHPYSKTRFMGLSNLKKRLPHLLIILDSTTPMQITTECFHKKIPVIGLVDSTLAHNTFHYSIPCNRQSTAAINLIHQMIQQALNTGLLSRLLTFKKTTTTKRIKMTTQILHKTLKSF